MHLYSVLILLLAACQLGRADRPCEPKQNTQGIIQQVQVNPDPMDACKVELEAIIATDIRLQLAEKAGDIESPVSAVIEAARPSKEIYLPNRCVQSGVVALAFDEGPSL